jgi:Fe-S oxidoreductase
MAVTLPLETGRQRPLKALEEACEQDFCACYQCGTCTSACPFGFSPQRVMRYLQLFQVEEALSLSTTWECASCTACTRECPHEMDPARVLKALRQMKDPPSPFLRKGSEPEVRLAHEAAAKEYRRRAHRLRSWTFAHIHRISRAGSALAPVSNWLLRLPLARPLLNGILGIHGARAFPSFSRRSFPAWFAGHTPRRGGERGDVALFHDTFMDYESPEVGRAAVGLLEAAGFRVVLSKTVCCGRPMLSKGYTRLAAAQARRNVEALQECARLGVPVVGCEPSCILTIRHEYPELLRGTPWEKAAKEVAGNVFLLDEFLDGLDARGELGLRFRGPAPGEGRVLFHGHCQQKTHADAEASLRLLRRAGFQPEMVQAGCCGMAGAFGFEREHYAASKAAFARGLGPAFEEEPETPVVLMGTSCRQQIAHFGVRKGRHLAEFLEEGLAE